MVKIYIFYICFFSISLLSENVFSQAKSGNKKGSATAKTIKPGTVVKGKVQHVKAEKPKEEPVRPSNVTNEALTNSIEIPVAKTVIEPKPNLTASYYAESLPTMDPGKNDDLMASPLIILFPFEKSAIENFESLKSLATADKYLARSVEVKDFEGKETLSLLINSYKVARSIQGDKNLLALNTYVFFGVDQLKASTDPYIKDLEKNKYLSKMILNQNHLLLPKEAKPMEAESNVEIR